MKITTVKISGFRPIPFCATYDSDIPQVIWKPNAFKIKFPATQKPYLYAFIGANSSGKSSAIQALDNFFSNTTTLSEEFYNCKNSEQPIVVEVTSQGRLQNIEDLECIGNKNNQFADVAALQTWLDENCTRRGRSVYYLTLIAVWPAKCASRINYIRKPDGTLRKAGTKDKNVSEKLFPAFRLIPATGNLNQELNPGKNTLMGDLFGDFLETQKANQHSLYSRIDRQVQSLGHLFGQVDHSANTVKGRKAITELEKLLADGLSTVNSGASVRFDFTYAIPSAESLFRGGKPLITDGIEIDPEKHGLGMQRSFVLATLRAWSQKIGKKRDNQDYFFAIEEPEIYLHPHAIRVMLRTLEEIASQDQIVFTTHSNEFVNRVPLKQIHIFHRINASTSHATSPELHGITNKNLIQVQRYLQEDRSDMLFARGVLLVEGQTEFFALPSIARTLGHDLDKLGISVVFTAGEKI